MTTRWTKSQNRWLYNRLYYLKLKQQDGYMESKKEKVKRAYRQKAIAQMIKDENINVSELQSSQELLDKLLDKKKHTNILINYFNN